jgi:hypothetical protein
LTRNSTGTREDQERTTGSQRALYLEGSPFCSAIWRAPYFVSTLFC